MTAAGVRTPIDGALATLSARLSGPRQARADVIAEVRDGLYDAAAAYHELGMPTEDAERRSLAEFGDLRHVADELQAELTARYARRTALLMGLTFPALVALWDGLWLLVGARGEQWASPSSVHAILASMIDVIAVAAGIAALGGLLALRLGARRSDRVHLLAATVGRICLTGIGLTLATAIATCLIGPSGADTGFAPGFEVGLWAVSMVAATWLLRCAVRCVRLARPLADSPHVE